MGWLSAEFTLQVCCANKVWDGHVHCSELCEGKMRLKKYNNSVFRAMHVQVYVIMGNWKSIFLQFRQGPPIEMHP